MIADFIFPDYIYAFRADSKLGGKIWKIVILKNWK
jgi:hypothetical protein